MGNDGNVISVDFGKQDSGDEAVEFDEYARECDRIREQNRGYLDLFERSMVDAGLKRKTIDKHLGNVDYYLNEYLLYYDLHEMPFGCHDIYGFLGNFFIRKCMWSTPASIKSNAASIKKFYKCMRENGLVTAADYDELAGTIKENMADWQADCAKFNDPSQASPFSLDYGMPYDDGADNDYAFDPMAEFDILFKDMLREEISERLGEMSDEQISSLIESAMAAGIAGGPGFTDDGQPWPDGVEEPTRQDVINVFTLVLFYLTSWDERVGGKGGPLVHKAWKSADWNALDALRESGLVHCTNKAKSVTITESGMHEAEAFLRASGFGYLVDQAR